MEFPHFAEAAEGEVVRRWPHSRRSVARARRELGVALAAWGLSKVEDSAALVLSELVTNAVLHARTPRGRLIETRWRVLDGGDGVRIEVHDANDGRPAPRLADDEDESGRGLALVDALTGQRWGVSDRGGVGKLVWAEVGAAQDLWADGEPSADRP